MGYALADAFSEIGAEVCIISGPVNIKPSYNTIKVIHVESSEEMYSQTMREFKNADIIVYAAAVADFTPVSVSDLKIKKNEKKFSLSLKQTKDIAFESSKLKTPGQITVGFALETDNEISNAHKKIKSKQFDFIVLNSLKDEGAGFAHDTNKITIIDKYNKIEYFQLKSKRKVAEDIVNKVLEFI
jgi:phosphopantothenoylcysteine decarboxylase/phosphopantothenate--cysteine ligase